MWRAVYFLVLTLGLVVTAALTAQTGYLNTSLLISQQHQGGSAPGLVNTQAGAGITASQVAFGVSRSPVASTSALNIGANRLALLWIAEEEASGSAATVSDSGRSWLQVDTVTAGQRRLTLFRSLSSGSTSSTVEIKSESPIGFAWTVLEYTNANLAGVAALARWSSRLSAATANPPAILNPLVV